MNIKDMQQELKGLTPKQRLMIKELDKKLIKAVIDDIPDDLWEYDSEDDGIKLKQQLSDKWLKGKDLV